MRAASALLLGLAVFLVVVFPSVARADGDTFASSVGWVGLRVRTVDAPLPGGRLSYDTTGLSLLAIDVDGGKGRVTLRLATEAGFGAGRGEGDARLYDGALRGAALIGWRTNDNGGWFIRGGVRGDASGGGGSYLALLESPVETGVQWFGRGVLVESAAGAGISTAELAIGGFEQKLGVQPAESARLLLQVGPRFRPFTPLRIEADLVRIEAIDVGGGGARSPLLGRARACATPWVFLLCVDGSGMSGVMGSGPTLHRATALTVGLTLSFGALDLTAVR
jgi:hypothetical protein